MSETIRLYGYFRSSCSYRVRIALAYKNIAYESIPIHLLHEGGQQYKPAYLARNPMGEVPTLEVVQKNGSSFQVAQSIAILEYLEECFPTPAMLPQDASQRARVRQLTEIVNSSIQPIQNLKVMRQLCEQFDTTMDRAKLWNRYWIARGFDGLEPLLAKTAKRFSFGDQVTFADAALVPQCFNADRFGIDMNKYPTIQRVWNECNTLDAFQKAHPSAQPDAA